jgi:hypothetical protein
MSARRGSLERIGDVLRARNDLEGALTNYREGLELRRALYFQSERRQRHSASRLE